MFERDQPTMSQAFTKDDVSHGPTAEPSKRVFLQLVEVGVPEHTAAALSSTFSETSYNEGEYIVKRGSKLSSWNLLISGCVLGSIQTTTDRLNPVAIYNSGSWFGEHSLINKGPSYIDYIAHTQVEMLCIPKNTFSELFETVPRFSQTVSRLMAWRVQRSAETLMLMKLGSLSQRVVMGIAHFADVIPLKASFSPILANGLEIPINQNLLASLCGVSRSELSDHLQQLKNAGWIRISYGKIELLSVKSWKRFAQKQRERKDIIAFLKMNELLIELSECHKSLALLEGGAA